MSDLDLDNLRKLEAAATPGPPADRPLPWHIHAENNYVIDADGDAVVWLDDALDGVHAYILHAANALPALLADHARLVAEVDVERKAHRTTADAAVAHLRESDTLREHQRAANQREDAMRAELLAERDAHHATCDALARERAEVARRDLRIEAMGMDRSASWLRIETLTAEVARLRGLVERSVAGIDDAFRSLMINAATGDIVAHRLHKLEQVAAAIRKEAAGE